MRQEACVRRAFLGGHPRSMLSAPYARATVRAACRSPDWPPHGLGRDRSASAVSPNGQRLTSPRFPFFGPSGVRCCSTNSSRPVPMLSHRGGQGLRAALSRKGTGGDPRSDPPGRFPRCPAFRRPNCPKTSCASRNRRMVPCSRRPSIPSSR